MPSVSVVFVAEMSEKKMILNTKQTNRQCKKARENNEKIDVHLNNNETNTQTHTQAHKVSFEF